MWREAPADVKWPFLRRSPRRTTLLGVAVLAMMLWAGVNQLGINVNELLAQLILLLIVLFAIVICAGVLAIPLVVLRRRQRRQRRPADPSAIEAAAPGDPASPGHPD